jgi:hypothetical protein
MDTATPTQSSLANDAWAQTSFNRPWQEKVDTYVFSNVTKTDETIRISMLQTNVDRRRQRRLPLTSQLSTNRSTTSNRTLRHCRNSHHPNQSSQQQQQQQQRRRQRQSKPQATIPQPAIHLIRSVLLRSRFVFASDLFPIVIVFFFVFVER